VYVAWHHWDRWEIRAIGSSCRAVNLERQRNLEAREFDAFVESTGA
jgi:hypothetical protein